MRLSRLRSACLATLMLVMVSLPARATVNQSMQDWFNDIGAYGNVTGPNAYRGQTMNLYTGGSLFMRTPVRNYQLPSTVISDNPTQPPAGDSTGSSG